MQYKCPMCELKREIVSINKNSFYLCEGCNNKFFGKDWERGKVSTSLNKKKRHNLYLPKNLHDKIALVARSQMRSFNNQCIVFLMQALEAEHPGWNSQEVENNGP